MQDAYEALKKTGHLERSCPLCDAASLEEFTHWRIIDNRFPYDKISSVHHMLVTKRHIVEKDLSVEERDELLHLKDNYLGQKYEHMLEALTSQKSIPKHLHFHLLVSKES